MRLVADKNPEKAAAILKDTIRKRLSNETYESLKKLYLLDEDAGLELADDVLRRLNSAASIANNQPVYDLIQLSTSIITDHVRASPMKSISPSAIRVCDRCRSN